MEQKQFSEYIFKFLEKNYPEFLKTIKFQDDKSFDCDLRSESGIFSIWIATYNCEITVGIEDPNGKTDIHNHIPCYELEDFEKCVKQLSSIIDNIKTDKILLYQSRSGYYDWIESVELDSIDWTKKFTWKRNDNVT